MKNKQKILFSVLVVVIVILVIFLINPPQKTTPPPINDTPVVTISPTVSPLVDQFEYQGEDGVDALTLLKQKTTVEQDSSGMVVSISGRQADSNQREFWSFYINRESAQVGPASYITKDNDIISWKIEKY
jgi:hypothetical protein